MSRLSTSHTASSLLSGGDPSRNRSLPLAPALAWTKLWPLCKAPLVSTLLAGAGVYGHTLATLMAHSRASFVDLDDNSPPTCNFDPINIVSSLFSSSPMAVPSSFKVPSPQARSLNASQPSIDKGKARMKSPEIIELSDSDIEDPKPKGKAPAQRLSAGRASTSNASGSQAHGACIQLTATPSPIDAPGSSQDIFQYLKLVTNEPTVQEIPVLVPVDEPHPAEPSNASVDPLDRLIASVIEIIPDVDPDHVAARYTLYREGAQEQGQEEDPSRYLQAILHDLFENPEYPRVSKKRKRHDDENDSTAGASNPKKRKKENVVKMDITSLDRPEILSDTYIDLSLVSLCPQWCPFRLITVVVLARRQISPPSQTISQGSISGEQEALRSHFRVLEDID